MSGGTCRLCGEYHARVPQIKYSVRHYAHADCALKKWGAGFFDRLHLWQLENFPYMVAVAAGFEAELVKRIEDGRRAEHR